MLRKTRISGSTSGGSVTISLTIPGTFTTVNPAASNFSGRAISRVEMFFGSPSAGDACTSFTVSDSNGVIPSQAQSLFPNYPNILSWADAGIESSNQGLYLSSNSPTVIIPSPNYAAVPSGLVLSATFEKASVLISDTIYVTIDWDDYLAIMT